MYKVIPHKVLFLILGWLLIGCVAGVNAFNELVADDWLGSGQAITIGWCIVSAFAWNPVWRFFWKKFPKLHRLIYPDLNGQWEVDMASNWSIHRQVIDAATGRTSTFDIDQCPECELAQLLPVKLKAEIHQTWFTIEIKIWNPANDTSIKRSDVISADPFGSSGLKPAGLFYFFKQVNDKVRLADDTEFYGAARVEYDADTDTLEGLFWTARMWDRGMNTAGKITYRRATG